MAVLARDETIDRGPALPWAPNAAHAECEPQIPFAARAAATYHALTGVDPVDADIGDDEKFDRHILASIISVARAGGLDVASRVGLAEEDMALLVAEKFPRATLSMLTRGSTEELDEEAAMVRDLLLVQRSTLGETGRWLASMVARRSIEPNHLWEDLGLRNRGELSRLLMRHFAPLASRNVRNMRWKRFFYRMLCEDDGFVMCTTPVCTNCSDFQLCFGDESGESRMADRRREWLLQSAVPSTGLGPNGTVTG